MSSSKTGRALLVLAAAALVFSQPLNTYAQEPVSVGGRAVNGTAGTGPPAGLALRMEAKVGETPLGEWQTTTDAEGRFTFTGVSVQPNAVYVVSAAYQGAEYSLRVDPAQPEASWRLTIYEATSEASKVRVAENTVFIPRSDPRRQRMLALEVVRVENTGDRTLVPDLTQAQPVGLLRFSLPQGAADLDVQAALRGGNVVPVDKGFALTTPLPPGSHDILFSYAVPYRRSSLAYTRTFPFGAKAFELVMAGEAGSVSSPGLTPASQVLIDNVRYDRSVARDLPPGSRLDLTFTGMPQPSLLRRTAGLFQGETVAKVGVPVFAGLVLAGLLALAIGRRRSGKAAVPSAEDAPSLVARQELLNAVADLDERFAKGALPDEEYRSRRAELLELLRQPGVPSPAEPPKATHEQR